MTVHLSYLETFFEHPTRRHIFANTVGRVCRLDLTLRYTYPCEGLIHGLLSRVIDAAMLIG